MLDPFTAWSRLWASSIETARTAGRVGEMMSASGEVVSRRADMMQAALRSPLDADHAELARMVPEKIEAFAQAGGAIVSGWWAMQAAMMAEAQHAGAMMMRGRIPSPLEASALMARNAGFLIGSVERASRVSAAALAPVHAKATANARRLKRAR